MRDPHAPRTGVLECEKGSASFYVDDFCFSIMNNVMKKSLTDSVKRTMLLIFFSH